MARAARRVRRQAAQQPPVWLGFCAVFVLGLADLRRLRSVRNLDLLVLVSLSVSLWFFNEGGSSRACRSCTPCCSTSWAHAVDRACATARRRVPARVAGLAARRGDDLPGRLSHRARLGDAKVIDVGYSGVIGAHRIASGQAPYGHFPLEDGPECGPADRNGRVVLRIQENGRCEGQNAHGDTYGPVTYQAYLPGYAIFGWKGKGDPPRGALHGDRLRPRLHARARARRPALRRPAAWRRRSRSPGPRTPSRSTSRARARTTRSSRRCSCSASGWRRRPGAAVAWRLLPRGRSSPRSSSRRYGRRIPSAASGRRRSSSRRS